MTRPLGTFSLVLHSHIPYVLAHGRSPHGTDWLSEAAAETYLPLLDTCHRLIAEGLSPRITLGLTPVLVEQLRDPSFQDELSDYLRGKVTAARANQEQFRRDGNYHMAYLARYWEDWYGQGLTDFEDKYGRDIVGAFGALQEAGHIEIITSSATHGYSALLSQDTSLQAQVKTGIGPMNATSDAARAATGCRSARTALATTGRRPLASLTCRELPSCVKAWMSFWPKTASNTSSSRAACCTAARRSGVYADKFGPLKELYKQFQQETVQVEYRPYTTYHGPIWWTRPGNLDAPDAGRVRARFGDGASGLERGTRVSG